MRQASIASLRFHPDDAAAAGATPSGELHTQQWLHGTQMPPINQFAVTPSPMTAMIRDVTAAVTASQQVQQQQQQQQMLQIPLILHQQPPPQQHRPSAGTPLVPLQPGMFSSAASLPRSTPSITPPMLPLPLAAIPAPIQQHHLPSTAAPLLSSVSHPQHGHMQQAQALPNPIPRLSTAQPELPHAPTGRILAPASEPAAPTHHNTFTGVLHIPAEDEDEDPVVIVPAATATATATASAAVRTTMPSELFPYGQTAVHPDAIPPRPPSKQPKRPSSSGNSSVKKMTPTPPPLPLAADAKPVLPVVEEEPVVFIAANGPPISTLHHACTIEIEYGV